MGNLREVGRKDYSTTGFTPTETEIKIGAIQRIADATEKMAASYDAMRDDRDLYKRWYEERGQQIRRQKHQIRALRGHITRLKRRAAK